MRERVNEWYKDCLPLIGFQCSSLTSKTALFDVVIHDMSFVRPTRYEPGIHMQMQRYVFLGYLFKCLSEDRLIELASHVPELFDSLTNDFVENPWIVNGSSYSETTKQKLLKGLHLGDFGRCEPKDPFTRQPLTEKSGLYLHRTKKKG